MQRPSFSRLVILRTSHTKRGQKAMNEAVFFLQFLLSFNDL
ncbi:hypothetical protein pah_c013o040 [Parachlamydia acanthamoebae str. Hall's coccus]|nr:hypothetical protein pah_c013o040 [Parachlamydia acanthamoebae str. Hall's coccus]